MVMFILVVVVSIFTIFTAWQTLKVVAPEKPRHGLIAIYSDGLEENITEQMKHEGHYFSMPRPPLPWTQTRIYEIDGREVIEFQKRVPDNREWWMKVVKP